MRLSNSSGESMQLRIKGYEFPNAIGDYYDANWLSIEIAVTHRDRYWTATDPCLLTYEVEQLAIWFTRIATKVEAASVQKFLEPNLKLCIIDTISNTKNLRVFFELEFRPHWLPFKHGIEEDLWLDFPLTELDLQEAANALRQEISLYPPR